MAKAKKKAARKGASKAKKPTLDDCWALLKSIDRKLTKLGDLQVPTSPPAEDFDRPGRDISDDDDIRESDDAD